MKFTADSIGLLREMVRIPSESFSEGEVASLLESRLARWGLSPVRYGNNVVAACKYYDNLLPTLVLDAHTDTVRPADDYTRNPYDPGENPDIVYGLGSNDDGASVVSMIAAFRHFFDKRLPLNVVLSLSVEEEKSGPDGASLLFGDKGSLEMRNAKWVIFGEPTGMRAATSERGLLVLDGLASGVSGHAARSEGVNALYIALDDINALRSHEFGKVSPLMGKVHLNVTQINAGTAHNVIPDKCSFVVDVRPTDRYSNTELFEELQSFCRSTLTPRNLKNSSSATTEGSALLKTASALGIETFSSPTTSNWVRAGGRDAIKMGPGDSGRSHKADEYVLCSEIEGAINGYIQFIETLYGNTLE